MSNKSTTVRLIRTAAGPLSRVAPHLASRVLERLFRTPTRHKTPLREEPWIRTARRSSIAFEAERSLALYSWGAGPTILLVHGWSGRASQMAVYAEPLVDAGFSVVAVDAPAHGNSDGKRSGVPEFAAAIESVAAHVGPIHGVVGHSMGTAAVTVALSRGLHVDRLVYLSPPANPGDYLDRAAGFLGFPDNVARHTQQRMEQRYGARFSDAQGTKLAANLSQPLLIIHDRDDTEVPHRDGVSLASSWSGAHLQSTEGLGHTRILRDEQVVNSVVRFIDGSSSGRFAGITAAAAGAPS